MVKRDHSTFYLSLPGLLAAGTFLLLFVASQRWTTWIPFPDCGMRRWFGLACPLCGGTRAFEALGQGRWDEAFWWNPLAVLLAIWAALWIVGWAMAKFFGLDWLGKIGMEYKKRAHLYVGLFIVLVLLNWGYACWRYAF